MIPASIRNNNPGAQEPGPSSRKFGSNTHEVLRWVKDGKPRTNKIATFATPQHGAAAQFDLLERKYTNMPMRAAVTKWCGSYWAGDYAKSLEASCGITGDQMLTKALVRDAARAIPLAKAMAKVEAGREFPMDDDGWQAAHQMAFGAALAPEPTVDNDVPFPKPEAKTREIMTTVGKMTGAIAVPAVPVAATQNITNAEGWGALGGRIASFAGSVLSLQPSALIATAGIVLAIVAAIVIKPRAS